ncbi:MAG: CPBP family intramembrane metalloprotease [Oscillospiraceae bacterium]|nr:CPBP family intramembrane metalloprotease [Oscillospiraceae bacterium]
MDYNNYGENTLPSIEQEGVQREFPEDNQNNPPSLRPGFKSVCARIGVMMIVVFGVRLLMNCVLVLLSPCFEGITPLQDALISFAAAFVFLNVIPIAIGMAVLKFPLKQRVKTLYSKPRYAGRAIGMFPAMYGAAMLMQILTLLLASLFKDTQMADSFNATQSLLSGDLPSAIVRFIQAVIFAPILEELWFRGLVLESLRPYGNGFAIFISAILFGITHANLAQFFYATAIGLFLAYIAIHTGSIIVPMILHAMMNGISSITSLIITDPDVSNYLAQAGIVDELPPVTSTSVMIYLIWNVIVLLLMAVGIIMFIVKLVRIKRYKVPKMQTELSTGTRWGIFLSRPTVIISLIFAVDTMTVAFITREIIKLLAVIFYG